MSVSFTGTMHKTYTYIQHIAPEIAQKELRILMCAPGVGGDPADPGSGGCDRRFVPGADQLAEP